MYFDKYKYEKIDFENVAFFFAPDCINMKLRLEQQQQKYYREWNTWMNQLLGVYLHIKFSLNYCTFKSITPNDYQTLSIENDQSNINAN